MARAGGKTTITWIWLSDALAPVLAALGSLTIRDQWGVPRAHLEVAKEWLTKWLAAGDLRWRCRQWQGNDAAPMEWVEERIGPATLRRLVRPTVYHEGDPRFFSVATINFEGNEASGGGAEGRGIEVARADLLAKIALLPKPSEGGPSKRWIVADLTALKAAGEILAALAAADESPTRITKASLSRMLAKRLEKAAKSDPSLRAIDPRSIANALEEWGLWPISSIK
jgi:hypothetical protein